MEGLAVEVPVAALPAVTFAASSSSSSSSASSSPPPFLCKTYDMVDDPATDLVVSWSTSSNSFVVWSVPELARDILPKYFKHNNFSSFVRQLNTYGFRKVDPDRWEFANEGFLRGQKHLLNRINRRKPTTAHPHQQQATSCMQSTASKSCVEVGKFGLDEEVERLKRDKNVLMQELVRLKQHQQNTDKHLQNAGQRVQVMEQRQQQMMSFLAKAMHNPGFLSQLVQQQNESSQHIKGINKKRRLPKNDKDVFGGINGAASDGQIVKFQPLMNEAAKSMLRQILKLDASPRRDQPVGGPNAFLIDGFEPPSALDNGYSTAQDSGVTLAHMPTVSERLSIPDEIALAHMPTVSEQLSIPAEIALPVEYSSVLTSDNLLSAQIAMNPNTNAVGSSEMNIHNAEQAAILPDFDHVPEALQEGSVAFSNMTFTSNETSNSSVMGPLAAVADESVPIDADESVPIDADELSSHLELDVLLDGIPKLPGSNDAFWEQFFSSISSPEDAEDNSNIIAEGGLSKDHGLRTDQPAPWDRVQHMSNLTEQMGLLSAESKRV